MEQSELKRILDLHEAWLNVEPDGKRACLSGTNLSHVNLKGADLP